MFRVLLFDRFDETMSDLKNVCGTVIFEKVPRQPQNPTVTHLNDTLRSMRWTNRRNISNSSMTSVYAFRY
jgi:hypothetical protein